MPEIRIPVSPTISAARELAAHINAAVSRSATPLTLRPGDVIFAIGEEIKAWPSFAAKVTAAVRAEQAAVTPQC